ncbi:MAG: type II secretion system F family protein, partial [Candidatus Zipacnadales bacterium]
MSIFRAGERSGDFSGACQEIVQQCETESRIRRHINLLKLYLGIILLVCILVPSFPRIISHVVEADPNRTTVVMTVGGLWEYLRPGLVWYGEHVVHDIVPWLVGVWVLSKVVGVVFYGPGRVVRHHLAFYLPVVGTATRKAGMARFLRVLELMQRAAVPLGDSVREAAQATGNCVMAGRLTGAAGVLEVGGRLSEVLRRAGLCSPSQISLVTTAEESGTLVEGLGQLANRAREERDSFLKG